MKTQSLFYLRTTLTALALAMLLGCAQTTQDTNNDVSAFYYDEEAFPDAKPWSSENFQNNPKNFQFAIIGDRTGGANALGTFDLAMDQINLLQPEFVINVGDLIEGYPIDEDDSRPEPPPEIVDLM